MSILGVLGVLSELPGVAGVVTSTMPGIRAAGSPCIQIRKAGFVVSSHSHWGVMVDWLVGWLVGSSVRHRTRREDEKTQEVMVVQEDGGPRCTRARDTIGKHQRHAHTHGHRSRYLCICRENFFFFFFFVY